MRHAPALALALLLAGCALAPPPPPETDAPPPTTGPREDPTPRVEGPCADVELRPSRAAVVPGEPLDLDVHVRNCAGEDLFLQEVGCGPPARIEVERDGTTWSIPWTEDARPATTRLPECEPGSWGPTHVERVAPAETHVQRLRWNVTFASDPCATGEPAAAPSCPHVAPAHALPHRLVARVTTPEREFVGEATVVVMPYDPWPAREQPFCSLRARVEPESIAPGEEARVIVRFENCGGHDVPVADSSLCGVANGVHAWVEAEGAPRRLGHGGPVTVGEHGCLTIYPPPRVVLPGAYLEQAFGWNGRVARVACGDAGCTTSEADTPAGEHVIRVELRPRGGDPIAANVALRIRAGA